MFSKIKSTHLIIIFAVLLGVFLLVKQSDKKKGARTFKSELVQLEPEEVTKITIHPKHGADPIVIKNTQDGYKVAQNKKEFNADKSIMDNLIRAINNAVPERVAAISKDKWQAYEVTDSTGIRVIYESGKRVLADVMIGKFDFTRPPANAQAQNPYQQQPRGKMVSYVRLSNEKEVYAVQGYLNMNFDRNLNSLRDRTVISGNKNEWTKITVTHPADSSFILEKTSSGWTMNGQPADSLSVELYLGGLRAVNATDFSSIPEVKDQEHTLLIEGNMDAPIKVTATTAGKFYVLTSSQNRGSVFLSKPDEIFAKIFSKRPKIKE